MGNTGWRRSKNDVVTEAAAPAASRRAVVTARKQRRGDVEEEEEEKETTRAGRRPRAGGVSSRAEGGGGDGAAPAGTVVTVKVVMTRKDAEALVARLNAQSARARKARMAELKGELRAGWDCGGGTSPASCRDAYWSPQLAPIKEN